MAGGCPVEGVRAAQGAHGRGESRRGVASCPCDHLCGVCEVSWWLLLFHQRSNPKGSEAVTALLQLKPPAAVSPCIHVGWLVLLCPRRCGAGWASCAGHSTRGRWRQGNSGASARRWLATWPCGAWLILGWTWGGMSAVGVQLCEAPSLARALAARWSARRRDMAFYGHHSFFPFALSCCHCFSPQSCGARVLRGAPVAGGAGRGGGGGGGAASGGGAGSPGSAKPARICREGRQSWTGRFAQRWRSFAALPRPVPPGLGRTHSGP